MSVKALVEGIPARPVVYEGTVPEKPVFPYVLLTTHSRRVAGRGLSRSVHGWFTKYRTTVVGLTELSVRIISDQVITALEGARVDGQRVELLPTDQPILEDKDHIVSGVMVQYGIQEFRVASPVR